MTIHEAGTAWATHARKHRTPTTILVLTLVGLLFAGLLPRSGAEAAASAPPAALFPKNGAFLGTWVKPRGGETTRDSIRRVEQQIGRRFAIDHQYYQWNTSIPTAHETWTVGQGRIPFINWKMPSPWRSVGEGSHDQWIASRADAFKTFGSPVYLSMHHEPENDGSFGSKGDFVRAFRHVVDIFRARGVTNVAFVWTMMAWSFDVRSGENIPDWYPGDDYVDFIGADGYNWAPLRPGARWTRFNDVFSDANGFAAQHDKPWMVVEYGAQEDPGDPSRKGAWLKDMLDTVKTWPLLKALIYFDSTKEYPWDTDSSSRTMAAYASISADQHLRQDAAVPPPTPTPTPTVPPSPTQTPPAPAPAGSATVLVNSLDVGELGRPLSIDNSSGGGSAFDSITQSGSSPIVFDRRDATGPGAGFSALHTSGKGGSAFYGWQDSLAWESTYWGRVYIRFNDPPKVGTLRLIRGKDGSDTIFAIVLASNGRLGMVNGSRERVGWLDERIELEGWARIEWTIDHAAGTAELRLYNDPGDTPTDIVRVTGEDFGAGTNRISIGRVGPERGATRFWTDVPSLSVVGWLGDDAAR